LPIEFPFMDPKLPLASRIRDLMGRMTVEEKASQLLDSTPAIPRLGVPEYSWWNEALHGVARAGRATVFPQAIGLAATFDPELIERVFIAVSDEARAKHHAAARAGNRGRYRGLTYWTPNVNIFRDPRWGRGQETYGEDPWLSGLLGSAVVRGLQGPDPERRKLAACAKHFAVHSGPEALRHGFDAKAGKKDLWETYLPAFKALVDAGVESVMGAYNRTNGEPCCASPTLIGGILRERWGFKGHFASDCWAIRDFHEHHGAASRFEESAAMALKAGCDLNCGCSYRYLIPALREGLVSEADIDRSLERLLDIRFRLGMFDPAGSSPYESLGEEIVDCERHRALARESAVRSLVLLKNDGVLPLSPDLRKIYVTGCNAASVGALLGNYYGLSSRLVSVLEGIVAKVGESVTVDYRPGCLVNEKTVNPVEWAILEAAGADITIAVMGYDPSLEGEEGDAISSPAIGDRTDIALPPNQLEFLRKLRARTKKLVLVLTGGAAVSVPTELADAIIMCWYPGEEGGNAVADVLFGDAVPSGKLPVTFYESIGDIPPYEDYSMEGRTYRYFRGEPLFPFGFGLSYARFEYSGLELSSRSLRPGGRIEAAFSIKNAGSVAAEETVQLYLSDVEASVRVPLASLRGVRRVSLEPGESKRLSFTIDDSMLALVDEEGVSRLEKGEFRVTIGSSSPGKRSVELGAPEPLASVFRLEE
jgi:beta-glucosidase